MDHRGNKIKYLHLHAYLIFLLLCLLRGIVQAPSTRLPYFCPLTHSQIFCPLKSRALFNFSLHFDPLYLKVFGRESDLFGNLIQYPNPSHPSKAVTCDAYGVAAIRHLVCSLFRKKKYQGKIFFLRKCLYLAEG